MVYLCRLKTRSQLIVLQAAVFALFLASAVEHRPA
jgi:hypothetical protein